LRVRDRAANWRIIYRTDGEAILIGEVFAKKTQTTPRDVIATCQKRFREYDDACR
jgi:phage-related protein